MTGVRWPGVGSVVCFDVGSHARADAFLEACELAAAATSFGGLHSNAERRARWGSDDVGEGFIRFNAGIEDTPTSWPTSSARSSSADPEGGAPQQAGGLRPGAVVRARGAGHEDRAALGLHDDLEEPVGAGEDRHGLPLGGVEDGGPLARADVAPDRRETLTP